MISVHKSVAQPWQCDTLGHLTTRFYVGMFDDELGMPPRLRVLDEVVAGDLLEVRASLMKIGGKSITAAYVMQNLKTGEVAATLEAVYVLFDLDARAGVKISDDLRSAASKYLESD